MARRVIEEVLDDFDPESVATDTISFGFEGANYEIDLSEENAAAFRDVMGEYIKVARKAEVKAPRQTRAASNGRAKSSDKSGDPGKDVSAIRAWARENNFTVNERGRIARNVIAAYEQAHA